MSKERLHLRLPATSANLGPGFDALALALTLYLDIEAIPARHYSIQRYRAESRGVRDRWSETCCCTPIELFCVTAGCVEVPLALEVRNGIPLGMGCGSSAATRLAGVALASHFGGLGWDRGRILTVASHLEGHPDNTAACWLGGFTAACWRGDEVEAVSLTPRASWQALIVMPQKPLATTLSRTGGSRNLSAAPMLLPICSG